MRMERTYTRSIVIHGTGTTPSQDIGFLELDRLARAKGYFGIIYHYVISRSGDVIKGRPENIYAPHCNDRDTRHSSIAVCLVGGGKEDDPLVIEDNFTLAQMAAAGQVVSEIQTRHGWGLEVLGANDLPRAGSSLPGFDVRQWADETGIKP